jgi:predicted ATPase
LSLVFALTSAGAFHQCCLEGRTAREGAEAATSLARLRQRQGQCAAARELLALTYGWFSEGFDTADLQEGMALLEGLA